MKATALFMAASALAAVSAGAYDGYGYDPRPASSYNDTVSGAAHIGYDSRYAYKDVVASSLLNRSGVFNIGGELNLNLARDWKQEIGAEYMAFCGGLPGYLSKYMGKAPHSVAQSVTAGLAYDDPGHGYFGSLDVQYGFYGMIGWRIDLNAGKRWSGLIHEKVDLELSAGTGYSSSYWGSGVAGFDQVNIKLAAPVRVTGVDASRGFRVIPFIQLDWAGNTRSEIRRYTGMSTIEDFRIRVGVEAVYRF